MSKRPNSANARWKPVADSYAPNLPEEAAVFDDANWTTTDVRTENGPLALNGTGVFRARFTVSAADVAARVVELWFGMIEGDGTVYLNDKVKVVTTDIQASNGVIHVIDAVLVPKM